MKRALLIACLYAGCAGDPCDGVAGACLAVHVDSPSAREVTQLALDVSYGADRGSAVTRRADGAALSLPVATAIALGNLPAPLAVRVVVSGVLLGASVGSGEAATTVAPGQHASVRVSLGSVTDGGIDARPDGGADLAAGCMPGGLYCGGDKLVGDANTLYQCSSSGPPTPRGTCVAGCQVRAGRDDACAANGGPCMQNGLYCGGDKVPGDPKTLYRCDGTANPPVVMVCTIGCQVIAGQNDGCL